MSLGVILLPHTFSKAVVFYSFQRPQSIYFLWQFKTVSGMGSISSSDLNLTRHPIICATIVQILPPQQVGHHCRANGLKLGLLKFCCILGFGLQEFC